MGVIAKGILRGCQGLFTPVSLGYPLSVFNKNSTLKGPAAQRPADAWITTAALYFIGVLFCCTACLEVSSVLEESPILNRGSQV